MPASQERQWYYVHIEHPRLTSTINAAFLSVLVDAYRDFGQPKNYRVYRTGGNETGFSYFFSPEAATLFTTLVALWGGVGVSEPTNLQNMERIL
ncbi:MAG TPA: hypothetical protein VF460_05475 [Burkholderiales bacterium]